MSSANARFTQLFTRSPLQERRVPNRTLASLLAQSGIARFDLLSMDIELGEPQALGSFPVAQYGPSVVVVEAHGETRQWLLDYFAKAGYVVQGCLHVDRQNLYFTPLSEAASAH